MVQFEQTRAGRADGFEVGLCVCVCAFCVCFFVCFCAFFLCLFFFFFFLAFNTERAGDCKRL